MKLLDALSEITNDLTAVLDAGDRYKRLLDALKIAIPYDAATLLKVSGDSLIPLAAIGLTPDALGRVYNRQENPRLDIICNSESPVLFDHDSSLPDPFDGMLSSYTGTFEHIHACLGCPLYIQGELVGVLAFDAINPRAFDSLPKKYLKVIAGITGAQLQTVELFSALEKEAKRQGQITSDLMQDINQQRGRTILGNSKCIKQLRREIELVAKSDFTILVLGETGVGKELVARGIHNFSRRSATPLLYLNCAALPDSLAESELFGHVQGAFTGAVSDRTGKFELADKGTLFLDEIGELSLEIQAKILRAIQEGEIQKIGSENLVHVDVRLIAATNRNLATEVANGKFRADLYHRLNVYPLTVPPLRERKDDIAILAGFFAEKTRSQLGIGQVRLSEEALSLLQRYNWPGNVRELENVISRSFLKASAGTVPGATITLTPMHLTADLGVAVYMNNTSPPASADRVSAGQRSLKAETQAFQIKMINNALERNNHSWAAAARELGVNRSNLHNLATRLGIRQRQAGG
jgi:anaerobic nitric oxide reductase transcription regulator